jgi:hypothetical protein
MTMAAGSEVNRTRGEVETLADDARVASLECDGDGALEVDEDGTRMTAVELWGEGGSGKLLESLEGWRREGTCAF